MVPGLKKIVKKRIYRVVVGRDARISGAMIQELVMQTLVGLGIHVIDVGYVYNTYCRSGRTYGTCGWGYYPYRFT